TYLALSEDMRSEVCVPMVVGDRVIGILNAESHQPEAFSENDERLLMTISGQLATAIEKARLFAEIAEALEREQRYNEVARTISSALDLPAILENVVRQAVQLVGADAGVMLLPSVSEDSLVPSYLYNLPASMEMRFVRPEEGLAWEVMESGRSVLVQEYGSNPSARPELLELNVHSVMEAPVKVGGKSIGVLCVFGMESRTHFTARDLSLVESVALQAGVAIQNARLFTETEQHAEELAAALARLEELDNLKSEFIQNVSHELRTPLAIIRGYVELLEMGELGELRPEQKGPIDIVARRARMLTKMVEELTTILEAESKKSHYEIVSLVPFIEGLLEDFQASAQEAGLTLLAEIETEEAVVLGDPVHLRRVLDNLLSNAFKFTPEGGAIAVGLRTANNHAILEVADTGIGIPEDKLERIFERFYQVDGSMTRRYGGTGLGLALVKEIVENHGGTIEVESAVGEGTVFHITLPLHQGSIPEEI
ncbi:MAG: ATP-binding protein, partial [Anaerolineae bacterium]